MPTMRIEADTDMCASSGMCALTAPELFDQSDEDGTVVLLLPAPTGTQLEAAQDAARRCPSGALKLAD
jgi:ferredoxin